jgi:spore maturation protein CgeB
VKILYSFNKRGYESQYWKREIAAASTNECKFIPFNHDPYLSPDLYMRAQLLDNLYYYKQPGLMRMYKDLEQVLNDNQVDALVVDTCPPYHPDYLRKIKVYKVLRIADGPISAYDRDFAYLHAYDHVLYHSPAYSPDMGIAEKLSFCGARKFDLWPLALFDQFFDSTKTEETICSNQRDIDIIFVGALFPNKMPLLAAVKKAFGRSFHMHGLAGWKKNLYFNLMHGFPGWVSPIKFEQYVPLYQRAKIGINVHNRGKYTVGSFRLFELPGNGIMQISDGGEYLGEFFKVGEEIESYDTADELVDKVKYYLAHDNARERIARAGYMRVIRDHRFGKRMQEASALIAMGMRR